MFHRRLPAFCVYVATVIVLSAVSCVVTAQDTPAIVASHSFKSPYNSFDTEGKRQIPNYAYGGNVDVNENFIRVTPDRAVSGPFELVTISDTSTACHASSSKPAETVFPPVYHAVSERVTTFALPLCSSCCVSCIVQSKRGWIWSRAALDADEWTATLRFRVSGQGKRLFGDGFALWFTQNRFHTDGALHGFSPKFTGAFPPAPEGWDCFCW
jgi:hypothetical protein